MTEEFNIQVTKSRVLFSTLRYSNYGVLTSRPFLGHSKLEKQAFPGLSDFLFPKGIYFFPD